MLHMRKLRHREAKKLVHGSPSAKVELEGKSRQLTLEHTSLPTAHILAKRVHICARNYSVSGVISVLILQM